MQRFQRGPKGPKEAKEAVWRESGERSLEKKRKVETLGIPSGSVKLSKYQVPFVCNKFRRLISLVDHKKTWNLTYWNSVLGL